MLNYSSKFVPLEITSLEFSTEKYPKAELNICECPCIISCPGHYKLMNNVTVDNADAAIIIDSSNVTLDLSGFSVRGKNTTVGISLLNKITRISITNGSLIGFDAYGIYSDGECEFVTIDSIITDRCGNKAGDTSLPGGIVFVGKKGCSNEIIVKNCTVTRSDFSGKRGYGILIVNAGFSIYNSLVQNCEITFCTNLSDCIHVSGLASIQGCKINNCSNLHNAIIVRIEQVLIKTPIPVSDIVIENNKDIYLGILTLFANAIIRNVVHVGNKHSQFNFSNAPTSIFCNTQHSIVKNAVIEGNSSDTNLDGIRLLGPGSIVNDVVISSNNAIKFNGVIASDYMNFEGFIGSHTISNVQCFGNQATEFSSITASRYMEESIIKLSVTDCKSQFNQGEGFAYDMSICSNSLINNCISQSESGGVKSLDLPLTISNSTIVYDATPLDIGSNTKTYNIVV